MVIRLDENYNAMTSTALLGYVGETNARPVSVEGMEIDGADRYVLTIDYGDGTVSAPCMAVPACVADVSADAFAVSARLAACSAVSADTPAVVADFSAFSAAVVAVSAAVTAVCISACACLPMASMRSSASIDTSGDGTALSPIAAPILRRNMGDFFSSMYSCPDSFFAHIWHDTVCAERKTSAVGVHCPPVISTS